MTKKLSLRQRMLGDRDITSCMHTRRQLQRFLDGESDPVIAARIRRHLDACRACGLEAQTYRDIKASLHDHAAPPPTETIDRLTEFVTSLTRG